MTRADEKLHLLLRWVYRWGFSDRRALWRLFGLNTRPYPPFFRALADGGWIYERIEYKQAHRRLVFLTPKAAAEARLLEAALAPDHPPPRYRFTPDRVNPRELVHALAAQHIALNYTTDPECAWPERLLPRRHFYRMPDAIVATADGSIGIEAELSRKAPARVYRCYFACIDTLMGDIAPPPFGIDAYHWHFFDRAVHDPYLRHFKAPDWPSYVRVARHYTRRAGDSRQRITKTMLVRGQRPGMADPLEIGPRLRQRFQFHLHGRDFPILVAPHLQEPGL